MATPTAPGALARRWRRLTRVRPTARGSGLLVAGAVLAAVGITLGLPDVVGLGAAAVLAVAAAWLWMTLRRIDRGRGALRVARRIEPNPAVRGQVTTARLTVAAARPSATTYGTLSRLRISEQAAHELTDAGGLRAQVATQPDQIAVRYRLRPLRRGRWPLGPLLTSRVDTFGLVRASQELGEPTLVAVWPRTTDLPVRGVRMFGDHERASAGARLSSSDDSVLREYVLGDDPRRVHWPSAARHGQLMVRSDESAGLPAVSVLLDRGLLPHPDQAGTLAGTKGHALDDGEWAVECAASIAVSLLRAGHPVRLVPTSPAPAVEAIGFSASRSSEGTAALLDETLDLRGHHGPAEVDKAVVATARALRTDRRTGEVTIAVLGPLRPVARQAVAAMGGDGLHRALVVSLRPDGPQHADALETASALRATGWHVAVAGPRTDVAHAWSLLVDGAR